MRPLAFPTGEILPVNHTEYHLPLFRAFIITCGDRLPAGDTESENHEEISETIADTTGAVLVEETTERDTIGSAESDLGSGAGAQVHTIVGSSETIADTTGAVLVEETPERGFVVPAES